MQLKQAIETVKKEIEEAAIKVGRNPDEITLIAVSKSHPTSLIEEAIECGLTVFGENRVQEAERKILELGHRDVEWHLIGHLQSNKAKKAVKLFDVIHSVDSIKLASSLERICKEEGRNGFKSDRLPIFIQVKLSDEETKSGIVEERLPELIEFVQSCEKLELKGLMTLPPFFEDVEKVRPYFRRLRELRDKHLPNGWLSMGMSHDFRIAIEEGATHVRIGTRIFGQRS
ncbi:MAG: YggS family pyridoxal phosphate-dependent enzyme [Acidobacteria bacterium]|jgi:pyridoxal phosphate enzyme (YggS family)|nr:MAG: YggS family pyridoxal phosphate-dependent enzyme [Acidobacteriota bacterium]GIU82620.1 MAG: YggS family pyridoxal phosphate enzyme [Pyrinomonadaceae bacterium]